MTTIRMASQCVAPLFLAALTSLGVCAPTLTHGGYPGVVSTIERPPENPPPVVQVRSADGIELRLYAAGVSVLPGRVECLTSEQSRTLGPKVSGSCLAILIEIEVDLPGWVERREVRVQQMSIAEILVDGDDAIKYEPRDGPGRRAVTSAGNFLLFRDRPGIQIDGTIMAGSYFTFRGIFSTRLVLRGRHEVLGPLMRWKVEIEWGPSELTGAQITPCTEDEAREFVTRATDAGYDVVWW